MASVAQDLAFGLALLIFSIAFVLTGFLILGIVFAAIVLLIGVIVFIAFLLPTILFFIAVSVFIAVFVLTRNGIIPCATLIPSTALVRRPIRSIAK